MISNRTRGYKTEAVVLRHIPLGEADRLLTIYALDLGKVRCVARGVRRIKSRLSGHIQPLNRISLSLTEGRNLDIVTEAEAINVYPAMHNDLFKLSAAMFLAELVDGFSEERSPSMPIYRLLTDSLDHIETANNPEQLIRYTQTRILDLSGFGPELHQCVFCQTALEPSQHLFSRLEGGIVCPGCRSESEETLTSISLSALKVFRFFQREPSDKAMKLLLDPETLSNLERILDGYTRFLLERDMKTTEFLDLVSSRRIRNPIPNTDITSRSDE